MCIGFSGAATVGLAGRLKFSQILLCAVAFATIPVATVPAAELTVVAWGIDQYHQCDVPIDLTNAVAVSAASEFSVALLGNGILQDWGDNGWSPPIGLGGVKAVSMRYSVGLAL